MTIEHLTIEYPKQTQEQITLLLIKWRNKVGKKKANWNTLLHILLKHCEEVTIDFNMIKAIVKTKIMDIQKERSI